LQHVLLLLSNVRTIFYRVRRAFFFSSVSLLCLSSLSNLDFKAASATERPTSIAVPTRPAAPMAKESHDIHLPPAKPLISEQQSDVKKTQQVKGKPPILLPSLPLRKPDQALSLPRTYQHETSSVNAIDSQDIQVKIFPPLPRKRPPLPKAATFVTQQTVQTLKGDLKTCAQDLLSLGFQFNSIGDLNLPSGCGYQAGVKVTDSPITFTMPITATCQLAQAYAHFQTNVIQPAAHRFFGQKVKKIHVFGSYQCRSVNHKKGAKLSRHARGDAIDIGAFYLQDGTRVSVLDHWRDKQAKGDFLRFLGKKACEIFDTVLTPDDDKYHQNHFHFDLGSRGLC